MHAADKFTSDLHFATLAQQIIGRNFGADSSCFKPGPASIQEAILRIARCCLCRELARYSYSFMFHVGGLHFVMP